MPVRQAVSVPGPPHVEYSFTALGRSLSARIAAIREWAYANMNDTDR